MAKISELNESLVTTLASLAEMKGERDALKKEVERQHSIILILSKNAPGVSTPVPNMPYPLFPYIPGTTHQPGPSNCLKCGIKLEGVMGYVCSHGDCPTGLGGAKC